MTESSKQIHWPKVSASAACPTESEIFIQQLIGDQIIIIIEEKAYGCQRSSKLLPRILVVHFPK